MPRKKPFSTESLDQAVAKSKTTRHVDFAADKPTDTRGTLEVSAGVERDGEKVDIEGSVNVKTDFGKNTSVGAKGSIKW